MIHVSRRRDGDQQAQISHNFLTNLGLLFHWARAVLGGLTGLAVVAALLRSFSPFSFVVWYIAGATLGTVFISPRRWRRGQAQVHPASSDSQN